MSAPLRIGAHTASKALGDETTGSKQAKGYVDRLVKLIPGEIVALYLAGKVQIASQYPANTNPSSASDSSAMTAWVIWTVVCLGVLVIVRRWATSDKPADVPPEWPAIGLTAVAFLIWVYSLGDVFALLGIFNSLVASLLVLVWTTVTPILYAPNKA